MTKLDRTAQHGNIAKLVEEWREAGDNSRKGKGGRRVGTGDGRCLPPAPSPFRRYKEVTNRKYKQITIMHDIIKHYNTMKSLFLSDSSTYHRTVGHRQ